MLPSASSCNAFLHGQGAGAHESYIARHRSLGYVGGQRLDGLRQASATSYYKGKDSLWVKLVSNGDTGESAPWWWNQPAGQP